MTSFCTQSSFCGDSIVSLPEFCDDGNTDGSSQCNSDCTGNAPGWYCSGGDSSNPSTCITQCWDGILAGTEVCDDGITTEDFIKCKFDCLGAETGWGCTSTFGQTSLCTLLSSCGNSVVDTSEFCDDGNTDGTSECNSDCTGNGPGWSCSGGGAFSPSTCVT